MPLDSLAARFSTEPPPKDEQPAKRKVLNKIEENLKD